MIFQSHVGFWKMLPVVFAGALGDSINPCAIVTLLLFLIFMFALKKPRRQIFILGSLYILGIFLAYFLIGLGLLKTFHLLGIPHLIAKIMAGVALLVGIATLYEFFSKKRLKFFTIPPSVRLKFMDWAKKASPAAAFGLGVLVGICEFPCTGGIYLAITGLLAVKVTYLAGLFWLLFYNIIFVLPLIIVLTLASRPLIADRVLSWEEQKSQISRLVVGIVMIVLAVLIWLWVS
jgi:cytochrome c biogenesis protein CcdA